MIINLQKTPLDSQAALRINGECDKVMKVVMAKLGLEIPEFSLKRHVRLSKKTEKDKKSSLLVEGLDSCGLPYSLFQSVEVAQGKNSMKSTRVPRRFPLEPKGGAVTITMNFYGRYGEPSYSLKLDSSRLNREYLLLYSIAKRKWEAIDKSKPELEESKDIKEDSKIMEEAKQSVTIPKIESKRVEAPPAAASQKSEFEIGEKDYGSLAS